MGLLGNSGDIDGLDLLASALTPQLRSTLMEGLSDPIMRKIAFSLSQRMRCPVQLLSCVNGVISHDSALSALPDVMLAGIADLAPLHGRIIIAVEGDLIGTVVDAMFGATSSDFVMRNDLSTMEVRIGKQMIELTLEGIIDVLSSFAPLNWHIVQYETAVSMLAIADKQDWMISTTGIFETSLGIGSIRAIVPYSSLEPFEARVNSQTWLIGPALVDHRWTATMAHLTASTQIDLEFDIVRTQVPLGIVRRLYVGQILPVAVMQHAVGYSAGLDMVSAEYGQVDGVICCRPVDAGNSELFLSRAQRPLEKLKEPPQLQKLHQAQKEATPGPLWIVDRVLVDLTVRLGETSLTVGGLSDLKVGQLVRLEQAADEPFAILIGGKPFGRGEVVSLGGGRYGLRIVEIANKDPPA
jgi:flagellar motor switch protein FliM